MQRSGVSTHLGGKSYLTSSHYLPKVTKVKLSYMELFTRYVLLVQDHSDVT